jgi:hypothetical protein
MTMKKSRGGRMTAAERRVAKNATAQGARLLASTRNQSPSGVTLTDVEKWDLAVPMDIVLQM